MRMCGLSTSECRTNHQENLFERYDPSSFSYFFHPIFIPLFGTLLYLFISPNYFEIHQKYLILLQVGIITILVPISFFYLLQSLGKIDSVMLSEISQRKIPLFIQAFLITILIQKGITQDRIPELFFFFLGGLISTLLAFILLFVKIKASIHMIGISSLTIFTIGLSLHSQINILNTISIVIILNGIIAASRFEMKAHTIKELVFGFLLGLVPQTVLLPFWL